LITLLTLPLFFASNALYPINALPDAMKVLSYLNPLTYFINGIRFFGIGSEFYSFGINYSITLTELIFSFGILSLFSICMFFVSVKSFKSVSDF
ncbi:MAG: ABC transporter permease, partial [Crenarchaeota archaeon]|nr:ABC transporter permease [Thermoproteota archaeon]